MSEHDLVPVEAQAIQALPATPEQLIAMAIQAGAGVETMERLLAMSDHMHVRNAQAAFIAAMAAFQGECPEIVKSKNVDNKYNYAPLESIIEQVKPLLAKHGFSYRFEMQLREGGVLVMCHVTHIGGHVESTPMDIPLGTKTPIMSNSQQTAAATTFAKRYAFINAFGIMTADEDNDGADLHRAKPAPPPRDMTVSRVKHRSADDFDTNVPPIDTPAAHASVDGEWIVHKAEIRKGSQTGGEKLFCNISAKKGGEVLWAVYNGAKINSGFTGEIMARVKQIKADLWIIEHIEAVMPPLDAGATYPDEAEGV